MSMVFECMLLEIRHSSAAFIKDTVSIFLIRCIITRSWLYHFVFLEKNTEMGMRSYALAGKKEWAWDEAKGEKKNETDEKNSGKSFSLVHADF